MSSLLLIVRLVLAGTFVVAGVAKLRDREGVRKAAIAFGVPEALGGVAAILLPIMELALAAALIPVQTAWIAAVGLLALLAIFTAAMSVALAQGKQVDCRCFGQASAAPIGWTTVARNVALGALAAVIVSRDAGDAGPALGASLGSLSGGQMINLALALVIIAGVFFIAQILKQYGRLLLRVEALEARAGDAVPAPPPGLPVGTDAPALSLPTLDGRMATLRTLASGRKPVLLVFIAPSCTACDSLLPEVADWQRQHGDKVTVALVSSGAAATRSKVKRLTIRNVLLQQGNEVLDAYKVPATPGAVLVRDGVIESAAATGPDAIRALMKEATLPPPVKEGDDVPEMAVRTLDGRAMDLRELPKRALLLFWNPGCGFCQQMLEGVKRWEGFGDRPELVIISGGSEDDVRANGFGSTVVVDQDGSVMRVFRASGTPSAVLVRNGRVASDLSLGADDIWKLAGVRQAVPA